MAEHQTLRMNSIESSLYQAIEDLRIRADVESCLSEIVADIEVASTLQQKCERHFEKEEYAARIEEYENALQEMYLLQKEEKLKSKQLGIQLSKELIDLSKDLGKMKKEHELVLEKLAKAEAELAATKEAQAQQSNVDNTADEKPAAQRASVETEEETETKPPPMPVETEISKFTSPTIADIPEPDTIVESTDSKAEPLVTLDHEAEEDIPGFTELDTEILMRIFGFLDALDILNTAQVNVSMYSRVDALFGFSPQPQAEDSSTIATNESNPTAPTQASTQPPSVQQSSVTSNVESTPKKEASKNPAGGLFAALLQPRRTGSPGRIARRSTSDVTSGSQPMNAAMASSMASKLTDSELNAIITMTERLKQKETLAEKLVKENEELKAKLDGTESVKRYLIERVREMEMAMDTSDENDTKIAQQIASDQEVIAFLDGRVQDLERELSRFEQEKKDIADELEKVMEQSEQKSKVMGDMLQFEREKLSESEKEWKATKKVLVKEVKNCRGQITALQAERDGYREQNERLRKTVFLPDRAYT